jgi:NADH-quinone oxidoreductase subunit E
VLSDEERLEIEEEIGRYAQKRAASVEALMSVQRRRGWVDDETLGEVASMLGMSFDELDGVATFYNLIFRSPVGKNVILLCDTISCMVMGYETILAHLEEKLGIRLGQTTADGLFTLLPVPCLGACERSPVMMVGEKLFPGLTPERVDEILREHGWRG